MAILSEKKFLVVDYLAEQFRKIATPMVSKIVENKHSEFVFFIIADTQNRLEKLSEAWGEALLVEEELYVRRSKVHSHLNDQVARHKFK